MKIQPSEWEKITANEATDKELISSGAGKSGQPLVKKKKKKKDETITLSNTIHKNKLKMD